MSWSSQAAAITDLRTLLNDGATDKYAYRKRVFGVCDSVNLSFKTFEYRRITDFTSSTTPLGIYKNGVRVSSAATDDLNSGEFTLSAAPVDGDVIEATYYYQWFTDTENTQFLKNSTSWLGLGTDPTKIPDGLQPAALYYAAQEAFHKMSVRWSLRTSNTYLLEDAPDANSEGAAERYRKLSDDYRIKSHQLRDDYYTRQGQSLQPLFSSISGAVRDPMPRR